MQLQTVQQGLQLLHMAQNANDMALTANVQDLVQVVLNQQETINALAKERLLWQEEINQLKAQQQEINNQFNVVTQKLGEENKALQERVKMLSEDQKHIKEQFLQLKTDHEALQKRFLNHGHPGQTQNDINRCEAIWDYSRGYPVQAGLRACSTIGKPVNLSS
jgi:seryl-tRNA synthetase